MRGCHALSADTRLLSSLSLSAGGLALKQTPGAAEETAKPYVLGSYRRVYMHASIYRRRNRNRERSVHNTLPCSLVPSFTSTLIHSCPTV
ncbi:hypothetical protein GY45DRAFT_926599 [Cubamyces sp. BRFM 1775]|nr:hypothetical protein GY45DRAFT_926599 [Cubamyces sp. BRFM 1775]